MPRSLSQSIIAFVLAIFLATIGLPSLRAYYAEEKQGWREATELALSLAQPEDRFLVRHVYHQVGVRYYASQLASGRDSVTLPRVEVIPRDWTRDFPSEEEAQYWLIVPFRDDFLPGGRFETGLASHYHLQLPHVLRPAAIPEEAGIIAPVSYGTLAVVPLVSGEPNPVRFWVDRDELVTGECTMLRWVTHDVQAAALDGQDVFGTDARRVCPTADTSYRLDVVLPDNTRLSSTVEVTVSSP